MSLWRQVTHGLRALTRREAADQDVRDEVDHYLEQAAAAHRARGLSPEAALHAARLETGNTTFIREQVRVSGWEHHVETFLADVRFGARRLRAAPGFTAITVLTLAVGVGGTTAIFSAVNPILFAPLPYPDAGRIMMIWEAPHNPQTFATYRELVDRGRSFAAIAAMRGWQPTAIGTAEPERLEGQQVSASYFRVLGIAPALGRDFEPSDDRLNGPSVVVLSDALWRRRFAADPAILGRLITLNGTRFEVIGIMPGTFENVLDPASEIWAPLQYDMTVGRAWGHHLRAVGRLGPGVSEDAAARETAVLSRDLAERHPEAYGPGATAVIAPLHAELTRAVKPALLAIMIAVVLVLVIAGVNVTNLMLARGVQRQGEFALRAALGAGRGRMTRQLLTESLLLAALGGVVGTAIAALGVRALVALSPAGLPRVGSIRVDGTMFAFGLVLTTLLGMVIGLTPALQASRSDPNPDLQHGTRRTAGGHRRTRGALVIAEVALALVLLVSSGLLLRSLQRLFAVDAGFDGSGVLTMQVQTAGQRFTDPATTQRFFDQALEAVRRVPGVSAAALTNQLPLSGDLDEYGVHFEAGPTLPAASYNIFRYAVSPGYLEAMHIPVRMGRTLGEPDRPGALPVAVISASLARRRFARESPLGQSLRIGPMSGTAYTIVGVVGDVKQLSLALSESDAVYTTVGQWQFMDNALSLVVRTRGDAATFVPAIRQAVWSVDKDQPIVRVALMDALLAATAAERRFALILFEAFALAALILAAAGIYGVLSGSVAERTREIGVRAALGASRRTILGLVLRQGMALTLIGVAIGVAGAVLASRAIVTLLFGISRVDPVTYAGVVALLLGVSALACWVPAWRAARVDPAITLRSE